MADRENVLQEADRIIHGERRRDYGDVKESFESLSQVVECRSRSRSQLKTGMPLSHSTQGRKDVEWMATGLYR